MKSSNISVTANGVLQIYQSSNRITIWVLGFDNWQQRIQRGGDGNGSHTGQGENTVTTERGKVRYNVKCKQGAGEGSIDHRENLERGWSDSPDDFVNIEQTGYVDVTNLSGDEDDQDVTFYGPSGRHTGDGPPTGCMGSTYKGSLNANDGRNRMAKEQYHVNYLHTSWQDGPEGVMDIVKEMNGKDKRVGFKYVNYKVGGYRRIETWVDVGGAIDYNEKPKNKWKLIRVQEDKGDWPGRDDKHAMNECECENRKQVILWGGPAVTYRWDDTTAKLSLATVQEINPPTTFYNVGDVVNMAS